ncbi:Serine carboxypeptidase-like 35 [Platanthera guangdongensis]|uniref:Carboxypeptidase n=1 Tax=Platanthera guangdongensis TaxID=2320717 RepID=A0ABR2MQ78_9ASPA
MASSAIISLLLGSILFVLVTRQARCRIGMEGFPEADLVTGLPGQPPVNFRHYAGYVGVGNRQEKALFYWFFEAANRPDEKPLVLWLNGGPGCSSVAYGAAQELGPFLVRSNGSKLALNPFSWNKEANLLFLEAPVGVGFSYTNRTSDLHELGDRVTADDSYDFLLSWFRRFPRFKSRDFYIAGESYAGHYVPQLSERILEGNKAAKKASVIINLKGFMIGNAVLNDATDQMGMVDYAWSHAIISDELHAAVHNECGSFRQEEKDDRPAGPGCSTAIHAVLEAYTDIDIYSIYTPVCIISSLSDSAAGRRKSGLLSGPAGGLLSAQQLQGLWHGMRRSTMGAAAAGGYDPCTEVYVETYFNREDVQTALHANVTRLPYPYAPCSDVIEKWNDSPATVLPILGKLMNAGLRVWVYSGDTDGRVPVTSTRYSINRMRLKEKKLLLLDNNNRKAAAGKGKRHYRGSWRPWYHKQQVAGWVVEYEEGLSLVTVRGAGHQVPVFAAARSLALFSNFLHGRTLPASRFPPHQ